MDFDEEKLQDILKLKDKIVEKIDSHQQEIDLLEKNLIILDSILKKSSFKKASSLDKSNFNKGSEVKKFEKPKNDYTIPITKNNDGSLIANAFVSQDEVSIVLENEIGIDAETPPFKTFFLERIIGGMKQKDSEEAEQGKLNKDSVIECIVNKNGTKIREIIIKNYKQKERVTEIVNTAAWSLSRMIENSTR